MLQNLFTKVVGVSIPVSIIIVLLTLTSPFMKKTYAAKWRYMIWIVLALRLVVPFNITIPSPLINLTVPENTIAFGQPTNPADLDGQSLQTGDTPEQTPIPDENTQPLSLWSVLTVIWLAGIVLFVLRQIIGYMLFKKKMRRWSKPVTHKETIAIFDRLCTELKIRKKPILKQNAYASSPMMYGFIHPVLVLQNGEYDERDSEVILKHELVHYKRHDLWYKLVLLFANAIHWFNPFAYLMIKSANDDIEYSCDDEVVKNADITFRKKYSQAILNSMHNGQARNILLSTQFKGGKKDIKNRFVNILDTAKKRNGAAAICVILILILAGGLLIAVTNKVTTEEVVLVVSPSAAEESANNMEDTALISMLEEILYPNSMKAWNWLGAVGLNLDYDTIIEAENLALEYVLIIDIQNMEALKANLEAIFSNALLSRAVYPWAIEGDSPLFIEEDGKLYINKDVGSGGGFAPDFTRAKVMSKSAETFEIEIPMTAIDNEEGELFVYKAVRQNGNWVLDSHYYFGD